MNTLQHQTHRLMIFDLEAAGHHALYIRQLLRHWPMPTALQLVVSPLFLQQHGDIVHTPSQASVTWHPLSVDEFMRFRRAATLFTRAVAEWQLFVHYASRLGVSHGLAMFFDRFQLPLALGLPIPCRMSGILFRPTLHYHRLTGYQATWRSTVRIGRETLLWRLALRHRAMHTLFSLDPLAVPALQQLTGRPQVTHLPDPIEFQPVAPQRVATLRHHLGIEEHRGLALICGFLEERKGLYPLLEALTLLPQAVQSQLCLLLVGQVATKEVKKLAKRIVEITQRTSVQVIGVDEFVPEAEMPAYFQMADFVLAPYQQHIGSSGILLWAAAAGKPVLASDYGLMGELVRSHQLGWVVNSMQPAAIAQGLVAFLSENPARLFDLAKATSFIEKNHAFHFVQTIYEHISQ